MHADILQECSQHVTPSSKKLEVAQGDHQQEKGCKTVSQEYLAEKGGNSDTCDNMVRSKKHFVKSEKGTKKAYTV